ncbi:hypothetical protein, partial [Aquincola tertiaricarbonis]|uniref:hypothetical protein n=1 Tax=Aquincola tertiaricarbonis TaxID=391953 RepID=UPI000614E08A
YTLAISASDAAGALDPLGYSIDWGDGTSVQTLTAAQLAALGGNVTHVFADDADGPSNSTARTISVTANDGEGGATTRTQTVNVNNVAPVAVVGGAAAVNEGASYALTVSAITEPGADTRTGYSIDWGDGTVQNLTPAQWAAAAGSFNHVYADGGNGGTARSITVSATDEDGTFVLGTRALTVNNVAPLLAVSSPGTTNEGATYTLTISASDAATTNDPLGYSIDWGDGSALQTLTAAQLAALGGNVTHVFADDQDDPVNSTARTISVTANDGDGGLTTRTQVVTVNNVAPVATVGGAASVNEGASYTLTVGAITEPGVDARTGYSIDWGDGVVQAFTPAQWAAAAGSFNHVYADGGNGGTSRSITVSATDEDGTFVLGSRTVTVNNLAPNLAISGAGATNEGATYTLAITASDAATTNDPLSYSIDWGDGTALQTLTAAQLAALG